VIDNQLAAQLLFEHKLATQADIVACWTAITPEKDVGAVLVEKGLLADHTYQEMIAYLESLESPQNIYPANVEGNFKANVQANAPTDVITSMIEPEPLKENAPENMVLPEGEGTIQFDLNTPELKQKTTRVRTSSKSISKLEPALTFSSESSVIAKESSDAITRAPDAISADSNWAELLSFARHNQASDIHLSAGNPILLRRYGSLEPANPKAIEQITMQGWIESALTKKQLTEFNDKGDLEIIYTLDGWGRYRVTLMKQRRGWDLTARVIPDSIRSFEDAYLPESCRDLTKWAQGLVLVTGPVGCGKSSTLATFVEMVNQDRHDHIITIEEPIEIVYEPMHCRITQREIGPHTISRDAALRAALREDPDIMVISELRDLDTIRLAVSAAETGHLVFGTMNTTNAARTVYRLIDSFPPEEQGIIRNMISESLRGVISQQLIPRKDGQGMVPAYEVLLITSAVANMIRKDEAHQLGTAMITGKSQGMVLLDDSLRALVEKGLIEPAEAMARAYAPKDFEKYMPRGSR